MSGSGMRYRMNISVRVNCQGSAIKRPEHPCIFSQSNITIEMEYIESSRGHRLLVHEGYIYGKDRANKNGSIAYKCRDRTCKGRAVVSMVDNVERCEVKQDHTHPPNNQEIEVTKRKNQLKKDVLERPTSPMKRLYVDAFGDVEDGDHTVGLPAFKKLRSGLYKERAKRLPKLPLSAEDIDLTGDWNQTKAGCDFVLIDTGKEDSKRIIAFGTSANLRLLSLADTYYVDGTFHTAPTHFYQLFIVHVFKFDQMIPVVYGLLPDKETETYSRFFLLLKAKANQLGMSLSPSIVQTDFEKAIQNAVVSEFDVQRLRGCYFHFNQCIWRAVQRFGLTTRYKEDELVGKSVRRAFGLPFVPLDQVEELWMHVVSLVDEGDGVLFQFLDYVTNTFVDDLVAKFPKEIWSHYDNIDSSERQIRTNNHLESFHGKIKKTFNRHPNIYQFIEHLKNEQESQELNLRLLRSGTITARPQDKIYRNASEKLKNLKKLLDNDDISLFEYAGKCSAVTALKIT